MIKELEKLCPLDGISGDEGQIRDYIVSRIKNKAEIKVDPIGNVIAFVKGQKRAKNRIMVSAHMDEVGMIVTYINSDGTLRAAPVGGIDPRVVFGQRVLVGRNNTLGVIGGAAIHNLSPEERKQSVPFDKIVVDIGTDRLEESKVLVSLGDSIRFVSGFESFGDCKIKCKAIDDRAGCAIMLKMIEEGLEYDTYFTFVVQEEIGLRGSKCAAYSVDPDIAIVLESTTAADIPSASDGDRVCELGRGAVVSYMDRSTVYDKGLYAMAFEIAEKNGIPCQTKTRIAGGNDAGAIHLSRGGVRTCAISLPCRYLHSPSCVIDSRDLDSSFVLAKLLSERAAQL